MNVNETFRKLVTNQYMQHFDYKRTEFSFDTVYHKTATSYCVCACGFEHEYLECISESEIPRKEIYRKVLQCILTGRCPHVDTVPKHYVRTTVIYGIHIAAAVGTTEAVTECWDVMNERTSGIYNLTPQQIVLIKNSNRMTLKKNPKATSRPMSRKINLPKEGLTILDAKRLREDANNDRVKFEEVGVVEYCARNRRKQYMQLNISDQCFIKALQVAFKFNLVDFQQLLQNKWSRMTNVDDMLEDCCTLAIAYNKPEFLHFLLHNVAIDRRKRFNIATDMASNLNKFCDALQRQNCKQILLIKQNFLSGNTYTDFSALSLSEADRVTILLQLLLKHNMKEVIIPILKAIPNISGYLNLIGGDYGTCLHAYNCGSGVYDTHLLRQILDLGVDINRADSNGMTPLLHLLSMKELWRTSANRETEELYIYENPELVIHESAVVRGLRADKAIYQTRTRNTPSRIGESKVYIMDGKDHGVQGHDENHFALNYMVPFLIECGFPISEDFIYELENTECYLDPVEQAYISQYLERPRSLLLKCRDTLRSYYKGRQIHKFVEIAKIPQVLKDFILLKPLLKCVSKELLN